MHFRPFFTASICGFALCAATSFANDDQNQQTEKQNPQRQNQANQNRQSPNQAGQTTAAGGQRSQGQGSDHMLASCIAIANQEEVAMARMAEEKASSNEVKEFARMLVKDHQSFLQKLTQFSPEAAQDGFLDHGNRGTGTQKSGAQRGDTDRPGSTDNQRSENQRRDPNVQPATATGRTTAADTQRTSETGSQQPGQQIDVVQLHKEIAQQCLNSAKEKLGSKSGKAFDECFMHAQVQKHIGMKDKLTVFERHASPQLAQAISEGLKTTEMHLKKAEEISKDLEGSSSGSKNDSKTDSRESTSKKSQ